MSMGDDIMKDIRRYHEENLRAIDEAALALNAEMLREIKEDTPVSDDPDSEHMKSGWRKKAYGVTGRRITSTDYRGAVYAVKNVNKPSVTHLLNFPHRVVVHRQDTGIMAQPVMHIPEIREKYQRRLNEEIERILGNG